MVWYIFTLIAVIIWASANMIDKYIVSKRFKNPLYLIILLGFFLGLISLIINIIKPSVVTLSHLLLGLGGGIIYAMAGLLFYIAIKKEELSRIIPVLYISPIFVIFFAAIFLGEILSLTKYLGILLLVVGAILISIKKWSAPRFNKASLIMVLASLLFSINGVLQKYLTGIYPFYSVFSYIGFGMFLAALVMFILKRKDFMKTIKKTQKSTISMIILSVILNISGQALVIFALTFGFVTLISGLMSVQPLIVFIFAILLTKFAPNIIKEEIDKRTIGKKFVAILFIILGSILIL